jgi:hypothetical protein
MKPPDDLEYHLNQVEVCVICAKATPPQEAYTHLEHAKKSLEAAMYACWHSFHTSGERG